MTIDPEEFFRNKIDNMLVTASWVDQVRDILGITGVSQIWDEQPAWYFWLSSMGGAYRLQLESAYDDRKTYCSVFSIKYYPAVNEKLFQTFSAEERSIVQSSLIDHTNTPSYDYRYKIPEELFSVGTVFFNTDVDGNCASLLLRTLTRMRIVYSQETHDLSRQKTDRNVPGWQVSYPLFERLAGLYAFNSKITPTSITVTREPGFKYVFDGREDLEAVEEDAVYIQNLNILFASDPEHCETFSGVNIEKQLDGDTQELLFHKTYSPGQSFTAGEQLCPGTGVSPMWWTLAKGRYKSTLASTCGCEHDHGPSCEHQFIIDRSI